MTEDNLISFFSANAQIFGALLGLLGLTFERSCTSIETNVTNMVNSLVKDLMKVISKVEENTGTAHLDIRLNGLDDLTPFIEKYRPEMHEKLYQQLRHRATEMEEQSRLRSALSKKFRVNCWISFLMIILSLAGLLVPYSRFANTLEFFAIFIFFGSLLCLILLVQFYISITRTTSIFVFND
jgi:hypothetical protein